MNLKHDMNIINRRYKDNKGLEFEVVNSYKIKDKRGRNCTVFDIRYIETGYVNKARRRQEIEKGEVEDHYAPTVAGVGAKGDIIVPHDKSILVRYLYETWKNILYRCYKPSCKSYCWYGEKGIKVCDRWLRFDWFFEDCKKLQGFDERRILNGELDIDKDINGGTEYNPDVCIFVSKSENRKEAADRRWSN